MILDSRKMAGVLIFVGTAQFFFGMLMAEALYPGYSISSNYVSDLGATCASATGCVIHQPSANIFNVSAILLGLLVVIGAVFLWNAAPSQRLLGRPRGGYLAKVHPTLVLLAGVGAIGAGVFPETSMVLHSIASFAIFGFAAASAVWGAVVLKGPFRYVSLVLGLFGFVALPLFLFNQTLGLGIGGMERMIVYPALLWALGFGAYLMSPVQGDSPWSRYPGHREERSFERPHNGGSVDSRSGSGAREEYPIT